MDLGGATHPAGGVFSAACSRITFPPSHAVRPMVVAPIRHANTSAACAHVASTASFDRVSFHHAYAPNAPPIRVTMFAHCAASLCASHDPSFTHQKSSSTSWAPCPVSSVG